MRFLSSLLTYAIVLTAVSGSPEAAAPELGDVPWMRNYEDARKRARAERKPLLILFDEVPGCQTCVRYGEAVLTHPLVVEAAQTLFVPVAVYNNHQGADRQVLNRFKEPTWHNPVVRIVDAEERSLAPRIAGDYSVGGLVRGMVQALEASRRDVPQYLQISATERLPRGATTAEAVFGMHCFWTGEVCLGGLEGIVATRTGFLGGREVVEVTYDPQRLSYSTLVRHANDQGCANQFYARSSDEFDRAKAIAPKATIRSTRSVRTSTKDDKYQLRHSLWRFVPMTPLQATRANHLIGRGQDPSAAFSPRQREIYQAVQKNPQGGWQNLAGHATSLRDQFLAAQALSRGP